MRNKKDNYLYPDRFNLIVIELNQEELASLSDENASLSNENASLSNENASLSNEISSLSNEITRLRKLLKDKGIDAESQWGCYRLIHLKRVNL